MDTVLDTVLMVLNTQDTLVLMVLDTVDTVPIVDTVDTVDTQDTCQEPLQLKNILMNTKMKNNEEASLIIEYDFYLLLNEFS